MRKGDEKWSWQGGNEWGESVMKQLKWGFDETI
jgi:hypothetical protein